MAIENEHKHDNHGIIPVEQAIELTTNWRNYVSNANPAFNLQSFWIPIETIRGLLLHNPDADGIRAYLGLETANTPDSATLVLVTTESKIDVVHRPGGESNCADEVQRCPPYCPVGSVLNQ